MATYSDHGEALFGVVYATLPITFRWQDLDEPTREGWRKAARQFLRSIELRCNSGHESPIGLWNCPTCTDPLLDEIRRESPSQADGNGKASEK